MNPRGLMARGKGVLGGETTEVAGAVGMKKDD